MLKELSHHASRDICRNQLEFSHYHLIYYSYANNLVIIYPADNSCGTIVCKYVASWLMNLASKINIDESVDLVPIRTVLANLATKLHSIQ